VSTISLYRPTKYHLHHNHCQARGTSSKACCPAAPGATLAVASAPQSASTSAEKLWPPTK
jgi:hypothetical protein